MNKKKKYLIYDSVAFAIMIVFTFKKYINEVIGCILIGMLLLLIILILLDRIQFGDYNDKFY